jgi:rare lipoprotein A
MTRWAGLLLALLTTSADAEIASVYYEGPRVATGARFDPKALTVAHRTLPFGTRLILRHGGSRCEVRVNDRGPFVRGRQFDLTPAVAKALRLGGLGRVVVEPFPPLPRERPPT